MPRRDREMDGARRSVSMNAATVLISGLRRALSHRDTDERLGDVDALARELALCGQRVDCLIGGDHNIRRGTARDCSRSFLVEANSACRATPGLSFVQSPVDACTRPFRPLVHATLRLGVSVEFPMARPCCWSLTL